MPRIEKARMMNYKNYLVTVVFHLFHLFLNKIEIFLTSFLHVFLTRNEVLQELCTQVRFIYVQMHITRVFYKKDFYQKTSHKNPKTLGKCLEIFLKKADLAQSSLSYKISDFQHFFLFKILFSSSVNTERLKDEKCELSRKWCLLLVINLNI